jgi:hypothetical protein
VKVSQSYTRPVLPLSEDREKQQYTATAQDCVNDLRRLAERDTSKVISRNYYRNNGSFSESVWNRFFGTFHEFKRQAGLVLTRQQHQLEKQVAKHASADHYRQMNSERQGYVGKYLRERKGRWKVAVTLTDLHDKEADPFLVRVFIDALKRIQPDAVCIGGDALDLPEFGKYTIDPREWEPVERIKAYHAFLSQVRKVAPDTQIDHIEGNHEFRLLRHLADSTPAMKAILADLHGFTVSKLLGLDQFEVNYIAAGDLAAYSSKDIAAEVRRNYKIYWDSFLVHHFPEGRSLGLPGMHGHHHKFISWAMSSAIFGAYNWYQMGAGHRRAATYANGEKWSNGFMITHTDTQTRSTVFEYVDVRDHAVVGGKYYHREAGEV